MFAATTSPSYSPTWVSGQMPLTSPIAQKRSPARRCSSTRIPCGPGSTPAYSVSLMEITGDLVTHETQYFADPFQAPASRAALAEPIADHDR